MTVSRPPRDRVPVLDTAFLGAACIGHEPELFFPRGESERWEQSIEKAKHICGSCTIRVDCLRHAVDNSEADGVWGGLTPAERRRFRRALRTLYGADDALVRRLLTGERLVVPPEHLGSVVWQLAWHGWRIERICLATAVPRPRVRRSLAAAQSSADFLRAAGIDPRPRSTRVTGSGTPDRAGRPGAPAPGSQQVA
ncbi:MULTISPECIES: WhiB family transcriptional regulator [unclassified Streptomyces]|uniref:WhiB family transcriptional regulator n=1 Tax=unclassified Streptomyces TaxID=2593676 RepID=UPI0036645C48